MMSGEAKRQAGLAALPFLCRQKLAAGILFNTSLHRLKSF
jgi:hypothetical protein